MPLPSARFRSVHLIPPAVGLVLLLTACEPPPTLPPVPAAAGSSAGPQTSTTGASPTAERSSTPAATPTGTVAATPTGTAAVTAPPAPSPASTTTAPDPSDDAPRPAAGTDSDVGEPVLHAITCDQTEDQVAASGAPRVTQGDATIYIGAQQVGGNDQAPRVVRFDDGERTWCADDLERSGDDGRGYGLLWSGDVLLGVFSATGNQGDPSADLRRFTGSGWLTSYADASPRGGGGPKVAALVRLDPDTGAGIADSGTWITANNSGKVNSATVTDLALDGDRVRVDVTSAFVPRRADRSAAECSGSSPFTATYTFDRSLSEVTAVTLDRRCS